MDRIVPGADRTKKQARAKPSLRKRERWTSPQSGNATDDRCRLQSSDVPLITSLLVFKSCWEIVVGEGVRGGVASKAGGREKPETHM